MKNITVPIIDISSFEGDDPAASRAVEAAVKDACENIGFLVVEGHGVPAELIDRMRAISRAFFDLPEEEKRLSASDPGKTMGYVPPLKESLAATREEETPPDLKEVFDIRRPDTPDDDYYTQNEMGRYFFRPLTWPERPESFRETWTEYYRAMEALASRMMRIFAGALDLPHDYFEKTMDRSVDYLRAINYPAQDTAPLPGQLRAGAHTDYGTLTLLLTEDAPGGLQVLDQEGEWVDVPHMSGAYVVNIGDMMSHWTNNRWVSTVHRVVNPAENVRTSARRQSIPFFQNPNYDAVIEAIPTCVPEGEQPLHEPFVAGEWLRRKQDKSRVA
ncbi:isopenicillin N synthase family oxygenase [Aeromicrobium sp. YIM 150415]|uniref:isopenicillin N synthase family dioxygenase n=1 Tax=Aeromicrobium sp. YIM 150415 TaxID=2803912 RepID=UPI001962A010|nr:isopenicillin N synthase family oxygenase [Aeromicrobium sp. YIM 150415]MBM9463231.1 isopenicillin N synthase family oxygenase [Aeromicrobium sp. YIM 150415]